MFDPRGSLAKEYFVAAHLLEDLPPAYRRHGPFP